MKILVTGGAGFVGSNLTKKLLGNGHEVVVLDNLSEGKNVQEGADLVRGDIQDMQDVARAMQGCEAVFHLAALIDLRVASPDDDYRINFIAAKNVFQAAKKKNVKIIFTSSAAVYGNRAVCKEEDECEPISQYGKSKLAAEKFLKKEAEDSFIVRPFNIYGPGAKSVINKFSRNMLSGKKITIFGNGRQTRDYVYVKDVVEALLLGLKNSGLYNVGTGKETQLLEIVDIISDITGSQADYKFEFAKDNEILRSKADISKILGLGWKPKVELEEGIRNVLVAEGWAGKG